MSDPLEEASVVTEMMLQESLAKRMKVPEKTGFCLFCEEPTEGAFCSADCRSEHELLQKINAIRGKR
jgi:hypothetical protein